VDHAAWDFFLKGLVIGFSIAAPVGPIGVLCIQRTLGYGALTGFVSGLGAATADAAYAMIAAFGLTFVSGFLLKQQLALRVVGGAFLLWLAWRSFNAAPADPRGANAADTRGSGRSLHIAAAYGSTVLLTLANPATILSFIAVFAGLGVGAADASSGVGPGYPLACLLVLGVFLGSALWWLILAGIAGYFREKMQPRHLVWVNRASGLIIGAFGVVALASLLFR
jgi:threonine/homoserine/homoserine lactone efflux protein